MIRLARLPLFKKSFRPYQWAATKFRNRQIDGGNIEGRIAALKAVSYKRWRESSRRSKLVDKIRDVMAPSVVQAECHAVTKSLAQRNQQSVVAGISIVGGQLDEGVLPDRIVIRVRKGEDYDRLAGRIKSSDQSLIGVSQAIHLVGEVADVRQVQHHGFCQLKLGPEADLVDIAAALVGVLTADLDAS